MKSLRLKFFFIILLLVMESACGALERNDTPAQPESLQQPVQPEVPPLTKTPSVAEALVATATSAQEQPSFPMQFFREEFDSNVALDNWDYFTLGSGDDIDLVIEQEDDYVLFDLGDEDLYVYYMYLPYEYSNASLSLNTGNRGLINNNISLVCRMNSDRTNWYEFSVESGGLWYLYAMDGKYNFIDYGDTNALKQGDEVNEYQLICDGDEITMYINGDKIKTVTETRFGFKEGMVGFNISSLDMLPIIVEVNWFEVSAP